MAAFDSNSKKGVFIVRNFLIATLLYSFGVSSFALGIPDESRFLSYRNGYINSYRNAVFKEDFDRLEQVVLEIVKNKARYEKVQRAVGVPWYLVGILHYKEAGFDFFTHFHNGDSLRSKTRSVPVGRPDTHDGPFTWEESAIDCLKYKGLDSWSNWEQPEVVAYMLERYNGFGYRRPSIGILSPYLWSGTTVYTSGMYTPEGTYDPRAVPHSLGGMSVYKYGFDFGAFYN